MTPKSLDMLRYRKPKIWYEKQSIELDFGSHIILDMVRMRKCAQIFVIANIAGCLDNSAHQICSAHIRFFHLLLLFTALQVSPAETQELFSVVYFFRFFFYQSLLLLLSHIFLSLSVDWFSVKKKFLRQIGNISSSNMYNNNRSKKGRKCKGKKPNKNKTKIADDDWKKTLRYIIKKMH